MAKYLLCGAVDDDGTPCNSNLFYGLYECKNTACSIVEYADEDPVMVDPDALPSKRACPGCTQVSETTIFECDVCGVIHNFGVKSGGKSKTTTGFTALPTTTEAIESA